MQTTKRRKPRAHDKGRFKLAVYFIDHQDVNGRPKYFWSKKNQDTRGISVNRLKKMVVDLWSGKVNWAAIYENDQMICEFKDQGTGWELR